MSASATTNFAPLDAGFTNKASYCVYISPGATRVIGDFGCTDATTAVRKVVYNGDKWVTSGAAAVG